MVIDQASDGIHISAELSLKYGLVNSGSEVQGAASASTHPDHPIRCTPMPQPRPASFGPGRAKGMSPQQRALVRVLFSKNQSTATLAIHFRVSPSMIKYAIDNNYSPPDDIEKGLSSHALLMGPLLMSSPIRPHPCTCFGGGSSFELDQNIIHAETN
jgi:hypothetical protein